MIKKCNYCNEEKDVSNFYKHPQTQDGYSNKCKFCSKEYSISNYKTKTKDILFIEKERLRGRKKIRIGGKQYNESKKKWQYLYPEKIKAHIKSGYLKKPFNNANAHHWSYNDEHFKDVIWLIQKDHYKSHRFIIYDQERKMYRRYDTNELLDTKQKHEQFILNCIKVKPD